MWPIVARNEDAITINGYADSVLARCQC